MYPRFNLSIHSNCLEQINKMRQENDALRDQLRSMNETINRRNDEIIKSLEMQLSESRERIVLLKHELKAIQGT